MSRDWSVDTAPFSLADNPRYFGIGSNNTDNLLPQNITKPQSGHITQTNNINHLKYSQPTQFRQAGQRGSANQNQLVSSTKHPPTHSLPIHHPLVPPPTRNKVQLGVSTPRLPPTSHPVNRAPLPSSSRSTMQKSDAQNHDAYLETVARSSLPTLKFTTQKSSYNNNNYNDTDQNQGINQNNNSNKKQKVSNDHIQHQSNPRSSTTSTSSQSNNRNNSRQNNNNNRQQSHDISSLQPITTTTSNNKRGKNSSTSQQQPPAPPKSATAGTGKRGAGQGAKAINKVNEIIDISDDSDEENINENSIDKSPTSQHPLHAHPSSHGIPLSNAQQTTIDQHTESYQNIYVNDKLTLLSKIYYGNILYTNNPLNPKYFNYIQLKNITTENTTHNTTYNPNTPEEEVVVNTKNKSPIYNEYLLLHINHPTYLYLPDDDRSISSEDVKGIT